MKTTWEKLEKSTGKLTVEINGEAWLAAQEKAFNKLAKEVEIPGFRKGKAPKEMVKSRISDQDLLMEALNENISDFYREALDENEIEPVAQPEVNVDSLTPEEAILTFNVVVKPEVTLGDYNSVKVDLEEVEVTEDEVNSELENLQTQFATMVVKDEDGKVEMDDTVVIDFEGFDKDNLAFDGGKGENFDLKIGSNTFIPGFEEQLIGLKINDEKEVNVTFPEEYQAENLAGQPAVFKVKLHEIKYEVVPELNDEFAKDVDREGVETLEDLKENIRHELLHAKEHDAYHTAENAYMEAVVATGEVEIPQEMIDEESNQLFEDFKQRLTQQGLTYDMYKQLLNQSDEDVLAQVRPDAIKRLEMRLVLEEIAKNEGITVTEEDITAEYVNLAAQYGLDTEQIEQMAPRDAIAYDVKIKKIYNDLMDRHYENVGSHEQFEDAHSHE